MVNIGDSVKRFDFDDKVQGRAVYTADLWVEDRIYAKIFRSTRQRARIVAIHLPKLPEGYEILDYHHIPGTNRVPIVYDDQPFLAEDTVNYYGEPILVVVGKDRDVLRRIMSEIMVDYEDIAPISSIEESILNPQGYKFADGSNKIEYTFTKGNPDIHMEGGEKSFVDSFNTGYQEHAYLETQSITCRVEDGNIIVHGSMQCPYYVVEGMKKAFDLDESRVRVIQQPTGGGFGGKEDYPSIPAVLCALAAIRTGKPVQLVYDRKEDIIASTKRHPSDISIKSYLDESNKITAMDIDIKLDGGAYAGLSSVVLQRTMFSSTGVYNIENLRVKGGAYATNNVVSSAFRGFGGPQSAFAIEMHMENIALALGLDPLEFKKKHFLRDGDLSCTQGKFLNGIKLDEISASINETSGYSLKRRSSEKDKELLKGIGFSIFAHGCGFTGAGESEVLKPKVRLVKYSDGTLEIFVSSSEIGQGTQTTLGKIVAHELGVPLERIVHKYPDSKFCPDSGPTVASRTILIVGGMLQQCAIEMKARWDEEEIEIIRTYKSPKELSWDNEKFIGNAYPEYSWGANVVEVHMDPATYQVEVDKIWTVFDIGTPIDLKIVQGQIEGGLAQGLGYGLMEEFRIRDGVPMQNSLTTYVIPSSKDFPQPEIRLIENPRKYGPFGGSGLGELPTVGVAPAIASAVQNALGKKVSRIPVTPEYIKELIDNGN
ncbi:xanthine dehydrogenase family protein molybdopterin-binding subunit [Gudongella sp. SC589]|uniref:xanthine dehydrogenase family protein molybdopterin-binding subunit n=1 Tax=Gudongella sp. SC589 TaxID=3385990 RepID=UPI003904DD7B